MKGLNRVHLIGNLGADVEIRQTQAGKSVAKISIATQNYDKSTEWHKVVLWEKMADNAAKYLRKGDSVYIGGRIQTRSWDDKEGNKRYSTEIVGDDMSFLSGGKSKPKGPPKEPFNGDEPTAQRKDQVMPDDNEEFPF